MCRHAVFCRPVYILCSCSRDFIGPNLGLIANKQCVPSLLLDVATLFHYVFRSQWNKGVEWLTKYSPLMGVCMQLLIVYACMDTYYITSVNSNRYRKQMSYSGNGNLRSHRLVVIVVLEDMDSICYQPGSLAWSVWVGEKGVV